MSEESTPGRAGKRPKAFISYSWSTPEHREEIRHHAERLTADGIEIVLDLWDLVEGQEQNAFMERMVADPTVTHVLVFCDADYVRKADERRTGGVGTESQIISQEVYARVGQTKFIPIFCELDESGRPCLPVFIKGRHGIDFSTPAKVEENWEKLIRLLHGKPLYERPPLGKPPTYLDADRAVPTAPTQGKLAVLRQVLVNGRPGVPIYRRDLVNAACDHINSLRPKNAPDEHPTAEGVIEEFTKCLPVRDDLATWVFLEAHANQSAEFVDGLRESLEHLLRTKFRTDETASWQDHWADAGALFVYNFFLHVVAALIKGGRFDVLRILFTSEYALPKTVRHLGDDCLPFTVFRGYSEVLANSGQHPQVDGLSPLAGLFKRTATAGDIAFPDLMEAELLVFLVALVERPATWYPATLVLVEHNQRFPLFARASKRHDFQKLARVTGITNAEELRQEVRKGLEMFGVRQWGPFRIRSVDFWKLMNLERLDSSP